MKRLAEREENILDFIIRDYIRSAFPVSSQRVHKTSESDLSPATIRNSMFFLDEEGFLEKPHASAGRIPTDKAYRYFVDNLMDTQKLLSHEEKRFLEIFGNLHNAHERMLELMGKMISGEMKLFTGVASFGNKKTFRHSGLGSVMKEPEFSDRELSLELAGMVDDLEKIAENYLEETSPDRSEIFIGGENPFRNARAFGAVSVKFKDGKMGDCVVFSIGPKRMNYERASALMDFALKDIMEKL